MGSALPPGATSPVEPDVAAAVGLLHRRRDWGRAFWVGSLGFLLAYGGTASADAQGTPPPQWFLDIVIALGVLLVVSIIATIVYATRLRRLPPAIRAAAVAQAASHRGAGRVHHYPPRHTAIWTVRWIGMLLILTVAVVAVPALVDGTAYLTGADRTVMFDPLAHDTNCDRYSCQTVTDGILETGGAGVSASWQTVVPLGKPFQVREPAWRWGLGLALINSDGTAVIALVVSLLIEGAGILVLIQLYRLVRNWRRHRQRQFPSATPAAA